MLQNQRQKKKEHEKKRNKDKDRNAKKKPPSSVSKSNRALQKNSSKGTTAGPLGVGSLKSKLTLRKDAKDVIFDVLHR